MPKLGAALDFAQLEGLNFRAHNTNPAPSAPVKGQLYFNNVSNTLFFFDGTAWVSASGGTPADATTGSKGIVQLAGDLAGTAASPQIAAGVITDVDVNAANKDGAVGTAGMRTLGAGAQQAMPGNRTLDAVSAPVASLNFNNQRGISAADPTGAQDVATKAYVDSVAAGLDPKQSVKAATNSNITLSGTQTVDGVSLIVGDRCLVRQQTSVPTNGIYIVASGAWTRATDMDNWGEVPGAFVFVEQGTSYADTGWVSTADQGGTLGTTNITWTQFSGPGEYTWGAGLAASGNTVDVGGTANRITVATDTVDIAATYVGQASITTLGTITTGVWNGTAIPVANGGTGSSTAPAARTALVAAGYYTQTVSSGVSSVNIPQSTHGLRTTAALMVQVQDAVTGQIELPDIVVTAGGAVQITWAAVTATNKIVTIIG